MSEYVGNTYGFVGGGVTVSVDLWICDQNNKRVKNITRSLIAATITLDMTREIFLSASFTIENPCQVRPYIDYLAPFINVEYEDGTSDLHKQIGLYATQVSPSKYTVEDSVGTIEGSDLCSVLAADHFSSPWNIPAGKNVSDAVREIVESAGITRYMIPSTSKTMAKKRTFRVGTNKLKACNALLHSIGFFDLCTNLKGFIWSPGKTYRIRNTEPWKTLTVEDILEPISVTPTNDRITNVVIVTNSSSGEELKRAIATNDDPLSPTSTVSLGRRIVKMEQLSGEVTQADLQERAELLLERGRTYYRTAEIKIFPDYTGFTPHQTVDLEFEGRANALTGRWWITNATMSFDSDSGISPLVLNINQLTRQGATCVENI